MNSVADEWRGYVTRQARWVGFENDCKTLDTDYIESVKWAFTTLQDKALVYEGFSVPAYCWRFETPLSNTGTGDFAGERLALAAAAVARYTREIGENPTVVERLSGKDLVGRS